MNTLAVDTRDTDVLHTAAGEHHAAAQGSRIIRPSEHHRMRWKNGAGWTSEIHCVPAATDWLWRLSIAEVEVAAPFSPYPGVERELVLLSGNGLRLHFDDGQVSELLPPHGGLRFPGERRLVGEPVDGPSRDFNLMWKRSEINACLWRRPLAGTMVLFVAPGETWVVHMLSGQGRFSDASGLGELGPGDTALLRPQGAERGRYALVANGEALVAHLQEFRNDKEGRTASG